jgi:hypothetical protein
MIAGKNFARVFSPAPERRGLPKPRCLNSGLQGNWLMRQSLRIPCESPGIMKNLIIHQPMA